jgi:hypothetical protein
MLTLTDHGRDVPFLAQAGSSLYDGINTLAAVYAGNGDPSDYAGLSANGKAVIVTRSDALTGTQRAQAAAAAGAKLVIVVNDQPGKLLDYVANDDGSMSIPDVSVTSLVGAPLVAQAKGGKLRLQVRGVPAVPYLYDLVAPYPNQIPSHLDYRPTSHQLATVDMRFYGNKTYASGEFRWDYRPYRIFGSGFPLLNQMPSTRTDYVSAQPGTSWASAANTGPDMSLTSSSEIQTFPAGRTSHSDWFSPVTRPRDGGGFWSSTRDSLSINFNVQPWADGGIGQAGYLTEGDQLKFKVYQNGTLVATSSYASASLYPIPDGTVNYRLDLRASRDPKTWPLSTSTHTVWNVVSPGVTDPLAVDLMPLMQLDYHVRTNLAGTATGGRQTVGLTASHLPGAVGAGKITGGAMWVSYDGGVTFHKVTLTKTSTGNWTTSFTAPHHGYVTLKAEAWDSRGNRITQEVTRAYGLK